jgi:single-stranded-DNA-specific exonuclease
MKWVLVQSDERAAARLSDDVGVHPVIATLLVNRGIGDPAAARSFLSSELSGLSEPGVFLHMEQAVRRIENAVAHRERVVVYGDYDVDGVTGSALLYQVLKDMGAVVDCYIPDRLTEGYGLNTVAIGKIKASGAGLLISVDCGVSAAKEAACARSLGLDLIITDHHESAALHGGPHSGAASSLPDASAVLHPAFLRPDVPVPIREKVGVITGVGVAFKLAQALMGFERIEDDIARYLDLVALGTVADVGKITGENRILVRHGLDRLSSSLPASRPGIAALKQVAGLNGKKITAGTVGFSLAPRINASGRMERADVAFRLLTTGSSEEAGDLAQALETANRERQSVEERIAEDARGLCSRVDVERAGALVLASRDWHPGVIGIVASRIAEEFYRPAALIAVKDGVGKGSARSIPGFDLYSGFSECAGLLMGFGGHKFAAGFTIAEELIPELRERLSSIVRERMGADGFVRAISIDRSVKLGDLDLPLMHDLERLAPFGPGNPEPRLGARELTVLSAKTVGNNHLKLKLRQEKGILFDAIAFNRGALLGMKVRENARIAAVFTPRLTNWNGTTGIELDIKDIKMER